MNRKLRTGETIDRADNGFEKAVFATSFNIDDPGVRPDVIVQANNVDDVITAVQRAERQQLKIAVVSGGHGGAVRQTLTSLPLAVFRR